MHESAPVHTTPNKERAASCRADEQQAAAGLLGMVCPRDDAEAGRAGQSASQSAGPENHHWRESVWEGNLLEENIQRSTMVGAIRARLRRRFDAILLKYCMQIEASLFVKARNYREYSNPATLTPRMMAEIAIRSAAATVRGKETKDFQRAFADRRAKTADRIKALRREKMMGKRRLAVLAKN